MGYQLNNRLELSVYIEDIELPIGGLIIANLIHMGTSLKSRVPVMAMVLSDTGSILDRVPLVRDGTRINITLQAGGSSQYTYKFRLFDYKRQPMPGSVSWHFDAYWDVPLWWAGASDRSYRGSTHSVLQEIANLCGIPYEGIPTADARMWSQQGMRYCAFAKYMVQRGYASDQSRMTLGFDLDGTLYYKDVNKLESPKYTLTNKQMQPGMLPLADYRPESDSGYANRNIGYSSTFHRQSLVRPQTISTLEVTPNTVSLQMNNDVKSAIVQGAPRYSTIDVGNSENSEQAIYQNARYGALFSQSVHMLSTSMHMPIRLLDWVNTTFTLDSGGVDEFNSGLYLITDRAIRIEGPNYSEKLLGRRHGINEGSNAR